MTLDQKINYRGFLAKRHGLMTPVSADLRTLMYQFSRATGESLLHFWRTVHSQHLRRAYFRSKGRCLRSGPDLEKAAC